MDVGVKTAGEVSESPVYIHYGACEYIPGFVYGIRNRFAFTKPFGGLWASREDSKYGWKHWCEDEGFRIPSLTKSFRFRLRPDARVLRIREIWELLELPRAYFEYDGDPVFLDFEKLAAQYDAVEVFISEDMRLYEALYGWDCDSILIMDPDIVVPV